ncbi:D-alanine--D-serine ligase [Enterococcus gilvus]|uniref:D-alanine--D-alanine ligase n=1 Tax=Enterococcus gilvus ATCC BAA-350 TaxID=1158614 RepID=R2VCK4_9ENTE|nr:D-alanine--D-serine ligase [Enterococcus gilvus]EOI55415.1 D-alanine-D-alanine ligase [Enterococcus gilvus ATCC BAA-350]EOW82042.1 hypothetical protein I592_01343 [Enterococcus gilvus ATCC BAA-350]OJG43071.1 D-alanine-D-alanine ligase [Enterococcus gilvus]
MKKIALIFGGTSTEHEVSLVSAASVLETMETMDFEIFKIGISKTGKWYLTNSNSEDIQDDRWMEQSLIQEVVPCFNGKGFWLKEDQKFLKPDISFPILHGGNGEDGVMQGVFEMMEIPYTGCGLSASSICMNKWLLHQFAKNIGINSTPTILLNSSKEEGKAEDFVRLHGFPIFVKPNEGGSSKGISRVTEKEDLRTAIEEAFSFGNKVILQKAVVGTEIGCGILGNVDLIVGECDEISLEEGFFDYVEKYQLLTAKINVPASIPETISEDIKLQAQILYRFLGCKGLARIDFFLTENGEILLNEVNTLPGFTAHSRFPGMLGAVGLTYGDIIQKLFELAEENYEERRLITTSESK